MTLTTDFGARHLQSTSIQALAGKNSEFDGGYQRIEPSIVFPKISYMTQRVKMKVRPGEALRLPAACVNCGQDASEQISIRSKDGQIVRSLDMPLCTDCHRELNRKSAEEVRLQRLEPVVTALAGLLILALFFLFVFDGLPILLRLFLALIPAILAAAGIIYIFRKMVYKAALPEKQNIRDSAQIATFTWRATTFEFTNDEFAQQFSQLNEQRLMD